MDNVLVWSGIWSSFFVSQMNKWESSLRWSFRFVLFWLTGLYGGAIAYYLTKLPDGSFDLLLSDITNPLSFALMTIIAFFSIVSAFFLYISGKIKSSL
ncbi:hypothetical protein MHO82_20285 [Vibrio sp. Of7-15]|uniref:hypothetical protein n=1 Tax=Vibrio sp. Of7-15 TaxID=2724879 RepID=UPI001EF17DC4|nr:hypothetical protein [Vibrio sp. Of7-15]MCG7499208.1 hypothetical protein [Vibrio sp. Of7-15]